MPPAESLTAGVAVEYSPIAGRGLFAIAAVPAGTAVVRVAAPGEFGPVNHSCEPNLGWADDLTLVAVRAVAAGAELTCDYATGTDDPELVLMCHCGTYRCRQLIEGTDWQIPQLQQRYADLWSPRLRRRIETAAR